ncbi:MAG: alpha/beta hydrolase [Bacillota bacterium]|nr:alpha/beta hydrolase [Bacillota bacterium]
MRGRPILLLHGVPLASLTWRGVAPLLGERGHRVVAVDLVGMGGSDKPLGFSYTLSGLTGLVEALLADLAGAERWVVAGHDLGGLLALRLAARRPELVAGVAALDATASPYHPFPWITLFAARPSFMAGVFRLGQLGGLRGILRRLWRPGGEIPEELVEEGTKAFSRPEAVWTLTKLIEGVGTTPEEELVALREELRGIARPVLVGRGEEDPALPAEATQDLMELVPGARRADIAEAGHLSPLEQPEHVAGLIAGFAQEITGGGAR